MESYRIEWKLSAEKDLRYLEQHNINRIINAIESLTANPLPPQHRKLKSTEAIYRLRVGHYRVIYQINFSKKEVTIIYVRHRKVAYRSL